MRKLLQFILILSILCTSAFAGPDDKRLALVRRVQGIEQLPSSLSRQLQILTMQVVTKQPGYELLLSGTDTPNASVIDMVAVESEVAKIADGYRIEVRLLDLKSKKLLTKASRDEVREEDLIRLFQGALESLFIADQEKEKEPKVVIPPPKTPNQPKINRNLPPTTQMNQPDRPSLDFRQRVRELKNATDVAIIKTVEEKKAAIEAAAAAAKKKESAVVASTVSPVPANTSKAKVFEKEIPSKSYPKKYVLMAGYDSRQIDSDYLVSITTKVQFLSLKLNGDVPLPVLDGKIAGSYELAYSRAISAPVEVPNIYQLGVYASWLETNWSTGLGIHRDASFFVNLPSPGEGLQSQSITSTWIRLKTELKFNLKGHWRIGANYNIPAQVESNYSPLKAAKKWQGTAVQLAITPPLAFRGWESNLNIEKINLTSEGERLFTLNESRIALSIRRSL